MSVFEPHTDDQAGGADQLPALDIALRGRKGQQVSAYIQDLSMRIDQERLRADRAERAAAHLQREMTALRNQPPPSYDHLGAQAARVLDEAGRSGKVLVEEAKERGKAIVEQARGHVAELIAAAEQRAEEIEAGGRKRLAEAEERGERILAEVKQTAEALRASTEQDAQTRLDAARQAADAMLAKANGERSGLQAESRRLREYRDGLLGYLSGVEADLSRFLQEVRGPEVTNREARGPEPGSGVTGPAPDAQPRPTAAQGPAGVSATMPKVAVVAEAGAPTRPQTPEEPDAEREPEAASASPSPPAPAPGVQPQPPVQSAIGGVRAGN